MEPDLLTWRLTASLDTTMSGCLEYADMITEMVMYTQKSKIIFVM